jgi:hypothetical protein
LRPYPTGGEKVPSSELWASSTLRAIEEIAKCRKKANVGTVTADSHGAENYLALCKEIIETQ